MIMIQTFAGIFEFFPCVGTKNNTNLVTTEREPCTTNKYYKYYRLKYYQLS